MHDNAPQHHQTALNLLNGVLQEDPHSGKALLAKAYIHEWATEWNEAQQLFSQAKIDELGDCEALEGKAWALIHLDRFDEGIPLLREVITRLDHLEAAPLSRARARWKLGEALWRKPGMYCA